MKIGFLILCLGAMSPQLTQAQTANHNTVQYSPVYPPNMRCSRISSLFGSMLDLDGSKRDTAHTGIDLGVFGDVVIAPADGMIGKIWPVNHGWGTDWNLLIFHTSRDLNLPDSQFIYYTEFDHLQRQDMPNIKAGDRVQQGEKIGIVRHPGNRHQFRAEIHMEVYKLPLAQHLQTVWRNDNGFIYWWNPSANLVDPLEMLSKHIAHFTGKGVDIPLFKPATASRRFKGFVYPLRC